MDCGKGSSLIRVLGLVLGRLVEMNRQMMIEGGSSNVQMITKFQSSVVPDVTIEAYLERIHKYARCSESCFIVALIYIDRIVELKNFVISNLNVHRVIITAVLLASKYQDDFFYNNAYYAKLGGVSVVEMNSLELTFLRTIEFSLHVKPELYSTYHKELHSYGICCQSRGPILLNDAFVRSYADDYYYSSQTVITPNRLSDTSLSSSENSSFSSLKQDPNDMSRNSYYYNHTIDHDHGNPVSTIGSSYRSDMYDDINLLMNSLQQKKNTGLLLNHGSLNAYYADIYREGVSSTPPYVVHQFNSCNTY